MKKFLFITAYLIAVVLGIEWALRQLPALYFQRQYAYLFEPDEILPYRLRKNSRAIQATDEFSVEIKTNSLGLRDKDYPIQKPDGALRILFLGDSFTYGHGVELEQTYVKKSEALLNEPENLRRLGVARMESISAGIHGYATDSEYLYFKERGIPLNPDIVVVQLFVYNDVTDIFYDYDWHRVQGGLPEKITAKFYTKPLNRSRIKKAVENLAFHSRLATALIDIALRAKDRTSSQQKQANEGGRGHFGFFQKELDADTMEAWKRWQAAASGIKSVCDKAGARLIFVIVPSEVQIYPEEYVGRWKQLGEPVDPSVINLDLPQKRIGEFLRRHKIETIDLLPEFRKKGKEVPFYELYFKKDNHWSPLGHEIVARLVAEKVLNPKGKSN